MDITIRDIEPKRLGALKHDVSSTNFGETWHKFFPAVGAQDAIRPGAQFMAVFRPSGSTSPEQAPPMESYAATMTLEEGQTVAAPLVEMQSPSGKYAHWVYKGSYEGLGDAWPRFVNGVAELGHSIDRRDWFEIYLDDPSTTAPEELRTALYLPVE